MPMTNLALRIASQLSFGGPPGRRFRQLELKQHRAKT